MNTRGEKHRKGFKMCYGRITRTGLIEKVDKWNYVD